jgi:hypothetical protein
MKNTFKILGIIALVVVIGITMAACSSGSGPEVPSGSGTANDPFLLNENRWVSGSISSSYIWY